MSSKPITIQDMEQEITTVHLKPGMTASELENWIRENMIGPRSGRDRMIMWDYLSGNFTYEMLAEKHDISVSTVQRIINKGRGIIFE